MKRLRDASTGGTEGAVYVEFLVAFMPVFFFFLCLVQLADLHQANLIVHHAVQVGVRAAAVVVPDDPQFYDQVQPGQLTGKKRDAVVKATSIPLRASRSISEIKLTFPSSVGGNDDKTTYGRDDVINAKLQAHFECRVPLVSHVVCDLQNGMRTLTANATMPNQGADYTY